MTWTTPAVDRRWERVVRTVANLLARERAVEGLYLAGSLVRGRDWFSDIDLGVATKDSAAAFEKVWRLRRLLGEQIGPPARVLERGWDHTRLLALLYGKSLFPPIGLEVDVAFSQLRYVGEQMPYAPCRLVFDRAGRLRRALAGLRRRKPAGESRRELAARMVWFGFYAHDALKAFGRRDLFNFQFLLEEMRGVLYHAAGERAGRPLFGSKRAGRYLLPGERKAIEASYREFTPQAVRRVARAYLACLAAVAPRLGLESDVRALERALEEVL
jgi:predicted nucleotidyltransferase